MSDRADFEAWFTSKFPSENLHLAGERYIGFSAAMAYTAWQAATERAQGRWLRWGEFEPVDGMLVGIAKDGVITTDDLEQDGLSFLFLHNDYVRTAPEESDGFLFYPLSFPTLPPTASPAPNPTDLPSDAPERDTGDSGASEGVSRIDELERRVAEIEAVMFGPMNSTTLDELVRNHAALTAEPEPGLRWLDHGNTYVLMRGDMPLGQVHKVFGVWVAEWIYHGGKNKSLGEFGNFGLARAAVEKAVEAKGGAS